MADKDFEKEFQQLVLVVNKLEAEQIRLERQLEEAEKRIAELENQKFELKTEE